MGIGGNVNLTFCVYVCVCDGFVLNFGEIFWVHIRVSGMIIIRIPGIRPVP